MSPVLTVKVFKVFTVTQFMGHYLVQKDDWGQEEAVELKTGFCLPTFLSTKSKAKNHSCATMCLCTWRGTNTYVETRLEFNTSNFGLCVIISWASGCILSFPANICWKLVLKGSSSFGGELQMEALAPFLDCGLAVWLAEREVMNKLRRSSCLGRPSSLECKQGWTIFIITPVTDHQQKKTKVWANGVHKKARCTTVCRLVSLSSVITVTYGRALSLILRPT